MSSETDPRFLRSRAAILDAARELLLALGPAAVTHNRIAEHAGIGRATVYRHWPRTDQLLAEAMATVPMPFFAEPTSPYRDWLTRELTAIARQLEHDDVLAVTTTLANTALWDPAMDARRAGFAQVITGRLAAALDEAERCSELSPRTAPGTAAAMAIGPIYYRATIERAPVDAELIEQCVAAVGDWVGP
ncbi:TetR/AcrR family transcriptional regulator [Kineosporia sp. R_H_3]|uniref:TetR/AcrR family transcriptional regulator n=1 Tax=Kineosporia sp. R_H_3 TaxID=1961848 RepID=UPI00130468FF|nr:TetR/AcrR family transcriptional regulator [Kineosporia sp. R_H_3]